MESKIKKDFDNYLFTNVGMDLEIPLIHFIKEIQVHKSKPLYFIQFHKSLGPLCMFIEIMKDKYAMRLIAKHASGNYTIQYCYILEQLINEFKYWDFRFIELKSSIRNIYRMNMDATFTFRPVYDLLRPIDLLKSVKIINYYSCLATQFGRIPQHFHLEDLIHEKAFRIIEDIQEKYFNNNYNDK